MLLMTINKFCFRGSPQFGLRAADDTLILYKQFFLNINFTKFKQKLKNCSRWSSSERLEKSVKEHKNLNKELGMQA